MALLLGVLAGAGCLPDARVARMQLELADNLSHGRLDAAVRNERSLRAFAERSYGPHDVRTYRARSEAARTFGCWLQTTHAVSALETLVSDVSATYGPQSDEVTIPLVDLAVTHRCAHGWNDADAAITRAAEICTAVGAGDMRGNCGTTVRWQVDEVLADIGCYARSIEWYLAQNAVDGDPSDRRGGASMLAVVGRRYANAGMVPEALWYLRRCVAERKGRYDAPPRSSEKRWSTPSGDVELLVDDSAHSFSSQAPRCLEDVIALERKLGDDDSADDLESWQRELWARGPDLEQKLRDRVRAAELTWHDDAVTSARLHDLGFYYAGKARHAEAIGAYEEAIGLLDRGNSPFKRSGRCGRGASLVDELLDLGASYEAAARQVDAAAAYSRAASIASADLNPDHEWRLEPVARLARAQLAAGAPRDSETSWRRYLAMAARLRGMHHADYAFGLAGLAASLDAQQRTAEADAARKSARTIRTEVRKQVTGVRALPLPVALRSSPPPAN